MYFYFKVAIIISNINDENLLNNRLFSLGLREKRNINVSANSAIVETHIITGTLLKMLISDY